MLKEAGVFALVEACGGRGGGSTLAGSILRGFASEAEQTGAVARAANVGVIIERGNNLK